MADRTISVKLSARVEQYISAMKAAEASTTGLSRSSMRAINQLGGSLQSMGSSMTRYVTVPIAALGAGAVYMAANFETAFAQMVGLANVPAEEVDHLREAVLSLAGETGRAPQELADALYLAASSGLDSAAAMDVVTLAAHGAAAGMGTTEDVTNLLTGAVGSYGAANLTAAQAADFLSATIREGRAAPEELATTMGRILPIAAAMGVGMGEVGGALAFLTNTGLETDQAVTGLRDALMKLATPGKKARQVLEEMGTSSDELKAAIAQDGLMGALELLREHGFNGNLEAMHALLPEVRGYNALTSLMADNTGTLDDIMGRVTDSTGSMGEAFDAIAGTDAFKMRQALAEIKVAMIEVGAILLPIAASAAKAIGDLAHWFGELPAPILAAVVAMAGLAATVGPLLIVAGTLLKNWKLLSVAMGSTGGMSKAATALGAITLAITTGVLIYSAFTAKQKEIDDRTREVADALGEATGQALGYADAAVTAGTSVSGLSIAQQALGIALANTGEDGQKLITSFGAIGLQITELGRVIMGLKGDTAGRLAIFEEMAEKAGITGAAMTILAKTIEETDNNGADLADELSANLIEGMGLTIDQGHALTAELMPIASAMEEIDDQSEKTELAALAQKFLTTAAASTTTGEKLVELAEAMSDSSRNADDAGDAYQTLLDIVSGMPPEQEAAARAALGLGAAVDEGTDAANRNNTVISDWVDAIFGVTDAAETSTDVFAGYAEALFGIPQATAAASEGVDLLGKELGVVVGGAKVGADGFDHLNKTLGVSGDIFKRVGDYLDDMSGSAFAKGFDAVADAAKDAYVGVTDFTGAVAGTDGAVHSAADAMRDFEDAVRDAMSAAAGGSADLARVQLEVVAGFDEMTEAVEDNGSSLDDHTSEGRANIEMLYDQADLIIAQSEAFLANGYTVGQVSDSYTGYRAQLIATAAALGLNEQQVNDLLTAYGLTPELVTTAFKQVGVDHAKVEVQRMIDLYGGIPTSIYTQVSTAISQGDYATAQQLLANLSQKRSVPITPYLTKTALYVEIHATGSAYLKSAVGRYVPAGSNLLTTVSEPGAGDEVILPLDNKRRMAELLGMSEVGPRVAAAMGGGDAGKLVSAGAMSGGGGDVYNYAVEVNMPPGANGDDVVRALRKWQRQSGPLPLATR